MFVPDMSEQYAELAREQSRLSKIVPPAFQPGDRVVIASGCAGCGGWAHARKEATVLFSVGDSTRINYEVEEYETGKGHHMATKSAWIKTAFIVGVIGPAAKTESVEVENSEATATS